MANENSSLSVSEQQQANENAEQGKVHPIQKILFVDDDEDDLLLFDNAIRGLNGEFELHFAVNAERMFSMLEKIKPDLIFLDLHLPGKSGITLLKTLRYYPEFDNIPIIIYSRLRNEAFINDCFNSRANYFIIKPVTFDKISTVINRILAIDWETKKFPSREEFVIS